ncbi:hypothetical protein RND71_037322 [Anisodus tanguticus]|uniref:Phospholipase/carboxylesterase/thioesterase domain-containing protein n=1 Tax=Anisodus tanguticus TaxID=243964 RepID=A0AAE1UTJ3_9SOLA|nr:hypothetical protein RND71_037322 [Anisodus tanguticus]
MFMKRGALEELEENISRVYNVKKKIQEKGCHCLINISGHLSGSSMSFTGPSMGSVAGTARRAFEFGQTYVVKPKGKHQATIVWLHGLGDNGSRSVIRVAQTCLNLSEIGAIELQGDIGIFTPEIRVVGFEGQYAISKLDWSNLLETLPLPNIKWICPTAPQRPITLFGGFPSTAWFDVNDLSENAIDDDEGLDASAAYVASLLATEPPHIKLGVGGFSMGAATSLYSATCFVRGKYENGNQYPVNLSLAVGLSGWLPWAKTLSSKLEGVEGAVSRATSLPILLCHGKGDDVVPYKFGDKSSQKLRSCGFQDVTFKSYTALGHYTIPEEMDEICAWLTSKLGLEGKS